VLAEIEPPCGWGKQVFRTGRLAAAAMDPHRRAMERFAKLAERAGARTVRAVATSAVRRGSNRAALVRTIRERTGNWPSVISGAEEPPFCSASCKESRPRRAR